MFFDRYLEPEAFCTHFVEICETEEVEIVNLQEDVIEILSGKDETALQNNFVQTLFDEKMPKDILKDPIKVAMITDLHINPYYTAGASNKCESNGNCC